MRRQLVAIAVSLIAAGVLSASAYAADCKTAPDAAAIDQYCELLPTADGTGLTTSERGNGLRLRDVVSKEALARLRKEGMLGEALLMLPVLYPGRVDGQGRPHRGPLLAVRDLLDRGLATPSDGDAGAVVGAVLTSSGKGGLPTPLAWILGITSVGGAIAGGMRYYRRRRVA